MDIKKYISSGILENYVLGLVNEVERQEVEKNLLQYPEIKSELDKIEDAVEQYAKTKGIPPPSGLLEAIMKNIRAEDNPPKTPIGRDLSKAWMIAAILAILLFLVSLWFFFQKSGELGQQQEQHRILQADCDSLENQLLAKIEILRNTGGVVIAMDATGNIPNAKTNLYWNEEKQTTYLDIVNLPAPPAGKQYQLWGIETGENPVSMGVFDLNPTDSIIPITGPFFENPATFAITLEDEGGKPTPNLDELVVLGNL